MVLPSLLRPFQQDRTGWHVPRSLLIILLLFLVLEAFYDSSTPILEASDELYHYAAVEHIAQGKGLPVLNSAEPSTGLGPHQEAGQAPLYYLLAAALIAPLRAPALVSSIGINPHSFIGQPSTLHYNKNRLLHDDPENGTYRKLAQAVHLARWFSILLGCVTVAMSFYLCRLVFASCDGAASLAAGLVASNPMVLSISASVDNDSLAMALCSSVTVVLAVGWRRGCSLQWLLILGLLCGTAALSKVSALGLLPLAAIVLLREGWLRRGALWTAAAGSLLVFVVGLIAGWWYYRNLLLYGDVTALQAFLDVAGRRPIPASMADLSNELPGLWTAWWGVFGVFDILEPMWLYRVYAALTMASGLGLFVAILNGRSALRRCGGVGWVPVCWLGIECVALFRWTSLTLASSGRLLFPAIASIIALASIGLLSLVPTRFRSRVSVVTCALLVTCAALVPVVAIRPAYAAPHLLAPVDVPAGLPGRNTHYGDQLVLLGATWPSEQMTPGSIVPVTLYWQAERPLPVNYSASMQFVAGSNQKVGQRDMLLGSGKRSTTHWRSGEIYRDIMPVTIPLTAVAPSQLRARLSVYQFGQPGTFPATPPGKAPMNELVLGYVDVRPLPGTTTTYPNPLDAAFGDLVALRGYALSAEVVQPGDTLTVTMYWQGRKKSPVDYTVFVHVIDESNRKAGQHDGQPGDGARPISSWQPGEIVEDQVNIAINKDAPPGQYHVVVGLYNLATMQRLRIANIGDTLELSAVTVNAKP
ncbi:MAG: hypothetical protein NVSMB52_13970 [Chloroflexota bacterium]